MLRSIGLPAPVVLLLRVAVSTALLIVFVGATSFAPRWIVFAQHAPEPAFDVASIKPSADNRPGFITTDGGRLSLTRFTLNTMIQFAYNVRPFGITGGPDWIRSERYDVEAKAEADYGELTMANLRPLLRSLLADRFKLGVHRESKELPIYELIVAKSGAKIQANTTGGAQVLNAVGRLSGRNQSVASFAAQVSLFVGRTVVDRTGLNGEYDYLLEWTPDPNPASSGGHSGCPRADWSFHLHGVTGTARTAVEIDQGAG